MPFPFVSYPHTFIQKCSYLMTKVISLTLNIIGVNLYASMFKLHLPLGESNIMINRLRFKSNIKYLLSNCLIMIPFIYAIRHRIITNNNLSKFISVGLGLFMINNLYRSMFSALSIIRSINSINEREFNIRLSRETKLISSNIDQSDSVEAIAEDINNNFQEKKSLWLMESNDDNTKFSVYNVFYMQTVYFLFMNKLDAEDFLNHILNIDVKSRLKLVDEFYSNKNKKEIYQYMFLLNRLNFLTKKKID